MVNMFTVDTLLTNDKMWIRTPYDRYMLVQELTNWLYANAGKRRYLKNDKDPGKIEILCDELCWGYWIIPFVNNPPFIDVNEHPKIGRFFFTDRNAALLFKLTWGGV